MPEIVIPPDSIYYVLTFLLGGALIWVIKVSIYKADAILKQLADTVSDLKTIVKVHEYKHNDTEKRLNKLEVVRKK